MARSAREILQEVGISVEQTLSPPSLLITDADVTGTGANNRVFEIQHTTVSWPCPLKLPEVLSDINFLVRGKPPRIHPLDDGFIVFHYLDPQRRLAELILDPEDLYAISLPIDISLTPKNYLKLMVDRSRSQPVEEEVLKKHFLEKVECITPNLSILFYLHRLHQFDNGIEADVTDQGKLEVVKELFGRTSLYAKRPDLRRPLLSVVEEALESIY